MTKERTDVALATIQVAFPWSATEYGHFLRDAIPLAPSLRWARRLVKAFGLVVVGTSATAIVVGASTPAQVGVTALPWFVLALFWWLLVNQAWRVVPAMKRRSLPDRPEERTLSAAGLDVAGPIDATYVPWSQVLRVAETEEFLLFVTVRDVYYIPKRLLSPPELLRARALILERLSPLAKHSLRAPAIAGSLTSI